MSLHRRQFLASTSAAAGAVALSPALAAEPPAGRPPLGKAEHCIFVWLGGGAGQIDTWDAKPLGDPKAKKAGAYYPAIDTAIAGVQVCEHLRQCAQLLDRFALIRTVQHEVIDEHAAAVNRLHTGRPTSGTIVYPSIGSIVAQQRGAAGEGVPAYVLIGYPNVTRGPGFLGAKYGYVYLTDTDSGPAGLSRPREITAERQARREALLTKVREQFRAGAGGDALVQQYDETLAEALRLSGPRFAKIFQLTDEPGSLRESYGGEFGQRCLLSRRLIEAGVRFVEVSHNLNFLNGTGWDVHNDGILRQHALIQELDTALAALVRDLEAKKLLDKTLIVVATEFGRPAQFDAGGGRGHHSKAFSCVLAGGGLKTGQVIGTTDELAMTVTNRPVSVPDFHATIHAALGIDPKGLLHAGERPVPITDGGEPIAELFG
ncbi:MAG: DUF1501 domain-containing protein [Planctomycetaceae bacterium]|nr:DUF1501 domain-containing protein [Planctomycetaceae bacterium]